MLTVSYCRLFLWRRSNFWSGVSSLKRKRNRSTSCWINHRLRSSLEELHKFIYLYLLTGCLNAASSDLRLAVGESEDEVWDVVLPSSFIISQSTWGDFFVILKRQLGWKLLFITGSSCSKSWKWNQLVHNYKWDIIVKVSTTLDCSCQMHSWQGIKNNSGLLKILTLSNL